MTLRPILPVRRLAVLAATVAIAAAACSSAASSPIPTIGPVTPAPSVAAHPSIPPSSAPSANANGCPTSAPAPMKAGETATVTVETSKGTIVMKIEGDLGPNAAGNFVALAECGFYDGVVFHRVVPDFVIQAGDGQYGRVPIANPDHMGVGGPGYQFNDEPVVGDYLRGTLAMANAGANTNGSQFFICLADLPTLPKSYTIFGKVTEGMDVVDKIAAAPQTPPDANGNTRPVDPVVINTATVSP